MWILGIGKRIVQVPRKGDVQMGAMDSYLSYGKPWRQRQGDDWTLAEAMALNLLEASLFFSLGRNRMVCGWLAVKLFAFSLRANEVWESEHGRPRHDDVRELPAQYYLDGMGLELLGWRGVELIRQAPTWTDEPGQAQLLAYSLFEARQHKHGRHDQDWNSAQWLLRLAAEARTLASPHTPNYDHFLQALGIRLFDEPHETARVFHL